MCTKNELIQSGQTSISNNVKLYKITDSSTWAGVEVTDKNVSVSLDNATKKIATVSHDALDANPSNDGWYEIRVMAAAKIPNAIKLNMGDLPDTGKISMIYISQ